VTSELAKSQLAAGFMEEAISIGARKIIACGGAGTSATTGAGSSGDPSAKGSSGPPPRLAPNYKRKGGKGLLFEKSKIVFPEGE
jgi:hypothetical protein